MTENGGALSVLKQLAPDEMRAGVTFVVRTDQIALAPWLANRTVATTPSEELVRTVWTYGMPHPLIARAAGPDRYELMAEPQLLGAARKAGLEMAKVLVVEVSDPLGRAIDLATQFLDPDHAPQKEAKLLRRLQGLLEAVGQSASPSRLAELTARDERKVEQLLSGVPRPSDDRR